MNAIQIDGKAIAETLRAQVARDLALLQAKFNVIPGLAVVLVGKDPASAVYVKAKIKQAQAVGFKSQQFLLPSNVDEIELLRLIEELNANDAIDGILVQLPLPGHIDRSRVLETIDPAKDVDGFHPYNVGRLAVGRPALAPCTPLGVVHLIKTVVSNLNGLDVVVIGRSNIVGKPLGLLLGDAGCTVTSAQLQTRGLPDLCRKADIVVAAAGCASLVRGDWLKQGAIVIDIGINRAIDSTGAARLVGDVAFAEASKRASYITPVPGGVGPMTVAYLLANTVTAAVSRRRLSLVGSHPESDHPWLSASESRFVQVNSRNALDKCDMTAF
ncbi:MULTISPECIES: bifunctional methylenetetrahydrofolate dehydrogenase/methenyltetrahydrofolate cyclohydrolase FolD [unclassified Bradyrhizobium]|uniref:bifunctional methylenetetrahydrofolate dehydrogenase/methenyltetrahydrofolate cyclohydrolase FolD n=1 Tax=unclassified Bradyrhizobium TaxID=2631580 RepID=UPI0024792BD3|nr:MULTISPECIES: bifunctional methylenetetrahydrofolate dehydrogenase/methenyltetrahydrofolate cyclohydrolase FolD [unclassified Bradyrhizobium]WGR72984.1 bifunctional methylenetetrahydrofolate dehydrogenase/methenyltetrahydrofolate cyclohydrolase FolD [Bradyrhizobium sp. ISRA426]WGR77819.1 bifunctional methylenetetrahydrofolate dehydrogenase/methenyltetrahydrofolate cyclohydrolase FolD [Bradyrhizobium sp. ISRA430]WGR88224.1 bifunctional methylenetetrahydrofolate dehydrogenase/methenyltetrahydro